MTERRWVPAALVAALTAAAFLPTLLNGFVNWDDYTNFLENPHYRGLGWDNLRWMFTTAHTSHYIPVTWLTLAVDYLLWGLDPRGYHATSLTLHTVNAVLVYLIAYRLLGLAFEGRATRASLRLGAAVAALLFATHPLRVESVAWATERRDVVMGLFTFLTVLAYLRAVRRGEAGRLHVGWRWAAVGLFALALLSKSIVVGLPLALVALDFYPLRRLPPARGERLAETVRVVAVEKAPFFALSAAVTVLMLAIGVSRGNMATLDALSPAQRLAVSAYSLVFYLWKTLFPWPLSPLYSLLHPVNLWSATYAVPIALAAAATAVVILARHRWPAGVVLWASYVILLVPVLGLFQNGAQIAADRYTYVACLGWALLGGAGVAWCWQAGQAGRIAPAVARMVIAATALSLAGFIGLTVRQAGVWRDGVTLWQQAAAADPGSDIPLFHLGWALEDQGRLEEARAHFERSLARVPDHLPALKARFTLHLGIVEMRLEHWAAAERRFRETLALDPEHPAALIWLGVARLAQGDAAESHRDFTRAAGLVPGWGRYETWEIRQAIEAVPAEHREARGQLALALGGFLLERGRFDDADEQFRLATTLLPDSPVPWNGLGVAHALRGQHAEALASFVRALHAQPGYREACDNARRESRALGVRPPELSGCAPGRS